MAKHSIDIMALWLMAFKSLVPIYSCLMVYGLTFDIFKHRDNHSTNIMALWLMAFKSLVSRYGCLMA